MLAAGTNGRLEPRGPNEAACPTSTTDPCIRDVEKRLDALEEENRALRAKVEEMKRAQLDPRAPSQKADTLIEDGLQKLRNSQPSFPVQQSPEVKFTPVTLTPTAWPISARIPNAWPSPLLNSRMGLSSSFSMNPSIPQGCHKSEHISATPMPSRTLMGNTTPMTSRTLSGNTTPMPSRTLIDEHKSSRLTTWTPCPTPPNPLKHFTVNPLPKQMPGIPKLKLFGRLTAPPLVIPAAEEHTPTRWRAESERARKSFNWKAGAAVKIRGLRSQLDLNGQSAEIVSYDAAVHRWRILLDGGEIVRIAPENIESDQAQIT